MTSVLVFAGDSAPLRAMLQALKAQGLAALRVSNSDDLVHRFIHEAPAGVVCDLSAPWPQMNLLIRRLRAHGNGRKYHLLLFGPRPPQATAAAWNTLALTADDHFGPPVDLAKLAQRLKVPPPELAVATVAAEIPSTPRSPLGFLEQGRIEGVVLPCILSLIAVGRGAGQLELSSNDSISSLFFRDGDLLLARVPTGPLSLAEMLISRGQLEPDRRLELAVDGFITLDTLMARSVLTPHEVPRLLKEQAERVVQHVVQPSGGTYRWLEGMPPPDNSFSLGINLHRQLLEGFKQLPVLTLPTELETVSPALDSKERELVMSWSLLPFELRAVNQLNGSRKIPAVVETLSAGNEDRERDLIALMTLLFVAGVVGSLAMPETGELDWSDRKQQLEEELERTKGADPFQVLGLDPKSPVPDIRARFFTLSKQYHPDRVFNAPPDIRRMTEEIFRTLKEAYELACDPKRREQHMAQKQAESVGLDVKVILRAEIAATQGERYLKNRSYDRARQFFEEAVTLNPHAAEYKALLGWATFLVDPNQYTAAAKIVLEAIRMDASLDRGYYFMGCIFKTRGDMVQAENAYKKAASVNPKNIEALRELRLLEMRRESEEPSSSPKKGFFDRFKKS